MAVTTDTLNRSFEVGIDTTDTVALWRLPGGSIERAFETHVLVSPTASFDFRVDVGVLPEGADEPSQESDIMWYQGAVTKNKSDSSDERETVSVTASYVRLVVTSAASSGETADVALTNGRSG